MRLRDYRSRPHGCLDAEERRQDQHFVRPGRTGGAADGAAGFRRDIDEIGTGAGRGAFGEIEAEAEIVQHSKLEAYEEFAGISRVVQVIEDDLQRIEEVRMRVTPGSSRSSAPIAWTP